MANDTVAVRVFSSSGSTNSTAEASAQQAGALPSDLLRAACCVSRIAPDTEFQYGRDSPALTADHNVNADNLFRLGRSSRRRAPAQGPLGRFAVIRLCSPARRCRAGCALQRPAQDHAARPNRDWSHFRDRAGHYPRNIRDRHREHGQCRASAQQRHGRYARRAKRQEHRLRPRCCGAHRTMRAIVHRRERAASLQLPGHPTAAPAAPWPGVQS